MGNNLAQIVSEFAPNGKCDQMIKSFSTVTQAVAVAVFILKVTFSK